MVTDDRKQGVQWSLLAGTLHDAKSTQVTLGCFSKRTTYKKIAVDVLAWSIVRRRAQLGQEELY